jgi:hypothetical protein
MKAVLSIPHHWQQSQQYAALRNPRFPTSIGREILEALHSNVLVYEHLPRELVVEIEWLPDQANPKLAEPTLFVEVDGSGARIARESADQSGYRFAAAMKRGTLATLIPDCQIRHRIVSEYQAPIGG